MISPKLVLLTTFILSDLFLGVFGATKAWAISPPLKTASVVAPVAHVVVAPAPAAHVVVGPTTKSFSEWKSEKVKTAREQLTKARSRANYTAHGSPAEAEAARDVSQEEFNLEVAQDLSVTDYLVLYLSQQPGDAKFQQAASRLTPEETAKIMEAYLKTMQSKQEEEKQMSRRSSAVDLLN